MSDDQDKPGTLIERLGVGPLWGVVLAAGFAVTGAIAALVLAMHRNVVPCPDGHVIEDGADPNCYAYPDAALGVSIVFACLAVLVLILLAARILLFVTPPRARIVVVPAD